MTLTEILEPSRLAMTITTSIGPSSADVIWPASAGPCARACGAPKAATNRTVSAVARAPENHLVNIEASRNDHRARQRSCGRRDLPKSLARFPPKWNHFGDKKSRQVNMLEHVLIGKVRTALCRNMLRWPRRTDFKRALSAWISRARPYVTGQTERSPQCPTKSR